MIFLFDFTEGSGSRLPPSGELEIWEYFLGCFGEMGGEWICLGVVDLLGIISFFLLSLVVRKLVVGYLKDTNAGECSAPRLGEIL